MKIILKHPFNITVATYHIKTRNYIHFIAVSCILPSQTENNYQPKTNLSRMLARLPNCHHRVRLQAFWDTISTDCLVEMNFVYPGI